MLVDSFEFPHRRIANNILRWSHEGLNKLLFFTQDSGIVGWTLTFCDTDGTHFYAHDSSDIQAATWAPNNSSVLFSSELKKVVPGQPSSANLGAHDGLTDLDWRPSTVRESVTSTMPLSQGSIRIFPNPVSDFFTIEFSHSTSTRAEVTLRNVLGVECAKLFHGDIPESRLIQWDSRTLVPGQYFCIVSIDGHLSIAPVIKW